MNRPIDDIARREEHPDRRFPPRNIDNQEPAAATTGTSALEDPESLPPLPSLSFFEGVELATSSLSQLVGSGIIESRDQISELTASLQAISSRLSQMEAVTAAHRALAAAADASLAAMNDRQRATTEATNMRDISTPPGSLPYLIAPSRPISPDPYRRDTGSRIGATADRITLTDIFDDPIFDDFYRGLPPHITRPPSPPRLSWDPSPPRQTRYPQPARQLLPPFIITPIITPTEPGAQKVLISKGTRGFGWSTALFYHLCSNPESFLTLRKAFSLMYSFMAAPELIDLWSRHAEVNDPNPLNRFVGSPGSRQAWNSRFRTQKVRDLQRFVRFAANGHRCLEMNVDVELERALGLMGLGRRYSSLEEAIEFEVVNVDGPFQICAENGRETVLSVYENGARVPVRPGNWDD